MPKPAFVRDFLFDAFSRREWNSDDCLEWPFNKNRKGYGSVMIAKKSCLVHRVSYATVFGRFPDTLHVCHKCDNPGCFNPLHLFLGTDMDNCQDRIRKGRGAKVAGHAHPRASIAEPILHKILEISESGPKQIAYQTGVSQAIIKNILYGKSWLAVSAAFYATSEITPRRAWQRAFSARILTA